MAQMSGGQRQPPRPHLGSCLQGTCPVECCQWLLELVLHSRHTSDNMSYHWPSIPCTWLLSSPAEEICESIVLGINAMGDLAVT